MKQFPRHPLTFGPSPVHPLNRLSDHLGGARVWAKREDVNSGLAFGGNKTRKLEYIVPDVLAKGADTLVSIGGFQSNHTRQVAAVAAHRDLAPHHSITTEAHPEGAAVYLEGEASRAIEFGHFTPSGRKWVEGMHFITGGRK